MERIKLNLIPSGVAPVVHLSQYDEGRKFGIDLFEGDSVYVLDGTETLTVNSRKPDGHVVVISVTNTGSSSLEVETVEQLTAVHGTSYAKLKIEKGSDVIATLEFLIAVSRDPLENGDPSESFVDNLNTQIAQAVSEQYDSANVVFDPTPTTGHGTGFAVTSEGVKTAIDNAIGGLSIPEDLNDLDDVDTTTPTQGEALVWDGTKWVNGTVSTVGNLDDLNDVDTTGKAEGDSLRYIGNEWKAKPTTVEMTKAVYDAISDFTPYKNTHIVIKDAPNLNATASDIEYSSGVTVADSLDSLNSETTPTITANTTYTSSLAINCFTWGKMVYAQVQSIVPRVAIGNEEELATGFPIPISTDVRVSLTDRKTGVTYRAIVNSSGALKNWYSTNPIPTSAELFGTIVYIKA